MRLITTVKNAPLFVKIFSTLILSFVAVYLSLVVSIWPQDYFWVERNNAVMPVWVRGNIDSGVFIIHNHGGPGSSGTLESIIEVSPGQWRFQSGITFQNS